MLTIMYRSKRITLTSLKYTCLSRIRYKTSAFHLNSLEPRATLLHVAGLHRLPPRQASGRPQQAGKVRPRLEFDAVFPSSKTTLKPKHLTCCLFCLESLKSTADDSKVSSKTQKPEIKFQVA